MFFAFLLLPPAYCLLLFVLASLSFLKPARAPATVLCSPATFAGGLHFLCALCFAQVICPPFFALALIIVVIGLASLTALAQQTNPVDRKVTNPMTDTPNVNPLTQEQPVRPQTHRRVRAKSAKRLIYSR